MNIFSRFLYLFSKLFNFGKIFSDLLLLPALGLRDEEVDEGCAEEGQAREDEVAGGGADDVGQGGDELSHQEGHQPVEGGAEGGRDSLQHTVKESDDNDILGRVPELLTVSTQH